VAVKEFEVDRGEFAMIVSFTTYNDVSESNEETVLRTHEKARPMFYTDLATLALRARDYFQLGELKLLCPKVGFSENDDGRFVRVTLIAAQPPFYRILPEKVSRTPNVLAGSNDPIPGDLKNLFLDAADLVENRIEEYIKGDREQPDLPEQPDVPPDPPRLFDRVFPIGGKRKPKQADN
jgi:hypothetical protein